MPTYEYFCSSCKKTFERFESMSAKPSKTCDLCKKRTAKRQISGGAGFLFKGDGFYVTDYRSSGYESDKKKAESKPESKGDSKSSKKKESKSSGKKKGKSGDKK